MTQCEGYYIRILGITITVINSIQHNLYFIDTDRPLYFATHNNKREKTEIQCYYTGLLLSIIYFSSFLDFLIFLSLPSISLQLLLFTGVYCSSLDVSSSCCSSSLSLRRRFVGVYNMKYLKLRQCAKFNEGFTFSPSACNGFIFTLLLLRKDRD